MLDVAYDYHVIYIVPSKSDVLGEKTAQTDEEDHPLFSVGSLGYCDITNEYNRCFKSKNLRLAITDKTWEENNYDSVRIGDYITVEFTVHKTKFVDVEKYYAEIDRLDKKANWNELDDQCLQIKVNNTKLIPCASNPKLVEVK